MNNVSLTGRLTADPRLEKSTTGVSVLGFTIAVNRQFRKEGGQQADFIRCVAWRKTAEFIAQYFKKGMKMEITGSLQSREYTEKETGKKRYINEVLVETIDFAESKSNKNENGYNTSYSMPAQNAVPAQTPATPYQQPISAPGTPMPGRNPAMPNPVNPMPQNQAAPVQQQPYYGNQYPNQNGFGDDLPGLDSDGFRVLSDDGDLPF